MNKQLIGLAAVGALVIGGGYIVYSGRPVIIMERDEAGGSVSDTADQDDNQDVVPSKDEPTPSIAVGEPNPSAPTEVDQAPKPVESAPKEAGTGDSASSGPKSYTMAEVQAHATVDSCWATINGSVYDLTTWVARHPGGPDKIISLCGTDGTERFNRKHGTFLKAQDALVLLKIGLLK